MSRLQISLLQSNYACALLQDGVGIVRRRGWRQQTYLPEADLCLTQTNLPTSNGFESVLPLWESWLQQRHDKLPRQLFRTQCACMIDDIWCRYAALPWSAQGYSPANDVLFAKAKLQDIYGISITEWEVRIHRPRYGSGGLACAIPRDLLSRLTDIARQYKIHLTQVSPHLLNRVHALSSGYHYCKGQETAVLEVIVQIGQVQCVVLKNGGWHSVRHYPSLQETALSISQLIERESLLHGLASPVVVINGNTDFAQHLISQGEMLNDIASVHSFPLNTSKLQAWWVPTSVVSDTPMSERRLLAAHIRS